MKASPATMLILAMFASFAIILAVMVALLRSGKPRRATPPRKQVVAEQALPVKRLWEPDSVPPLATQKGETGHTQQDTARPEPPGKVQELPRRVPVSAAAGGKVQRKLEQELREMQLLRRAMKKRLDDQLALKSKLESDERLEKLARLCDLMEPGEALRILIESGLDDQTIGHVLKQMNREQALRVAALLKSLGRDSGRLFR